MKRLRKILMGLALSVFSIGLLAQVPDTVNVGSSANDGTGDNLRSAFIKVNSNDQWLDSVKFNKADTVSASTELWMLADTVVLGSFSKDTTTATGFYGSFYNNGSDTLVVTEMIAVLQGSTPSVTVDVQWHSTFNSGSATQLNTTPPAITSTTTGDSDTSFNNSEIPPGVWVWMETPTITTAATYISVTLMGYRKNSTY